MNRSDQPIEALLDEERLFPPPEECSRNANMADPDIYQRAAKDPEAYWAQAAESLEWKEITEEQSRIPLGQLLAATIRARFEDESPGCTCECIQALGKSSASPAWPVRNTKLEELFQ